MKKIFILQGILTALVFFTEGCASDDNYCCISNDQCVPVHGKDTFCTVKECGKCEAPEQPLQISADWKDAVVGKPYEVELTASGGFSPYEWVGLSKLKDPDNKLAWLILEKDPNDSTNSKAYLRNVTNNGQPLLPSTPTTDTDELTIEVTVRDNTQHGDSGRVAYSNIMKINKCGEASDCTDLPPSSDAACVEAACNAGKCEYPLKSTDTVCLAGGCRDGFVYEDKKCNASGICVAPSPEGTSCNGYQCTDATACKTSCSSQADCAGALLCKNDNTCTSPQALGATCTVDGECVSNHCANKRCCESACNGVCQVCGTDGHCNQMPTDDSRCGIIDCSSLNNSCRTYSDLTTNRCASFGVCKNVSSCTVFTAQPTTTICRASTDVTCDPAEYCDSNGNCPADTYAPNTTVCRVANGTCDVAENCTGTSAACPDNAFAPGGTSCATCKTCDAYGNCNQTVLPTVSLSATSPIPVEYTTTLTWSSTCAISCVASGGWSGSKTVLPGTELVTPTADTTYSLECTNSEYQSASTTVTINVAQWNDTNSTNGDGNNGESCNEWLLRTGQKGINDSPPRVNLPDDSPPAIISNACVYGLWCSGTSGTWSFCPPDTKINPTGIGRCTGCGPGKTLKEFWPTYDFGNGFVPFCWTQTRR